MCTNPKHLPLRIGLVGLFLSAATVCQAEHSWNGYHWKMTGDTVSPTVVNKTTSSLYDVPAGVTEWSNLGTPIQPTLTNKKGKVTVTEAFSPLWLGLARIFIKNGHITKGEVKLNTELLESGNYGTTPGAAADHVLGQELGHVWGLDHNRVGDASPGDDTVMNDSLATLGLYTSPNQHDTDELNSIYAHSHSDGGGGGNGKGKKGRNRFDFTGSITHVTFSDFSTATYATAHSVPEPSTFAAAAVGLLGLLLFGRKPMRRLQH